MNSSDNQKPCLVFSDVCKSFRSAPGRAPIRALSKVCFNVAPGQIVGLVGPNGSGKTTAFRIAAGLLKHDEGSVQVMDSLPGAKKARFDTGYMPELPGVPGTLKPRQLLDFIGRVFGKTAAQRAERSAHLEELLSISSYMNRSISKLSKGMSKRVSLAAALYNAPPLLLLDEPLEGLDPLGSAEIKEHLSSLARSGAGVLISSHILSDIETVCSWIIILNKGKVILNGPRDSILAIRDQMEIRFKAPKDRVDDLLLDVSKFIRDKGGSIEFSGHPVEGLETLFKKMVTKEDSDPSGEKR